MSLTKKSFLYCFFLKLWNIRGLRKLWSLIVWLLHWWLMQDSCFNGTSSLPLHLFEICAIRTCEYSRLRNHHIFLHLLCILRNHGWIIDHTAPTLSHGRSPVIHHLHVLERRSVIVVSPGLRTLMRVDVQLLMRVSAVAHWTAFSRVVFYNDPTTFIIRKVLILMRMREWDSVVNVLLVGTLHISIWVVWLFFNEGGRRNLFMKIVAVSFKTADHLSVSRSFLFIHMNLIVLN